MRFNSEATGIKVGLIALFFSVIMHILIALWLLETRASTQLGAGSAPSGSGVPNGSGEGRPIVVALLRSPASWRAASHDVANSPAHDIQTSEIPTNPAVTAREAEPESTKKPLLPVEEASASVATGGSAAPGSNLSSETAGLVGGDVDGAATILTQIARCLPKGSRPHIPLAKLELDLDMDGNLRQPPRVVLADPLRSPADALEADHIVQAALQCGPYKVDSMQSNELSLPVDFARDIR